MKKFVFAAASFVSFGTFTSALAGPTGGTVVQGQGTISSPVPGATVIDQASNHLHLNWSSFNVGANESVQFNQPSSSAVALNRILDQNPSQVFGRIGANGRVILVNPNGLLIGPTAQFNVGSLVASSLDVTGFDSATGRYTFGTSLANPGAVLNEGLISAAPGGSVTLLGGRVSNTGTILADFGTVNLAAGRAATLDLVGDGLLRLEVGDALSVADGADAVANAGTIQANGGQVQLTAAALEGVFANLVNNTGVVRANRLENIGGTIRLLGPEGVVRSSGTLDASAGDAVSTGGRVEVLGERVGLFGNAIVDVSGSTGGGTALIGGDFQGKNPDILNAKRTVVDKDVTIDADAGATGNGGRIIVWSDDATYFGGHLNARGGDLSGNGGFAEVSGKQWLGYAGSMDLRAPHGTWGTLLLDPVNIQITNSNDSDPAFTPPGDLLLEEAAVGGNITLGNDQIEDGLAAGTVELQASNGISQDADADIVSATPSSSLILRAGTDINLAGDVTLDNGNLVLDAGGNVTMQGAYDTGGGDVEATSTGGAILFSGDILTGGGEVTFDADDNINMSDGSSIATAGGDVTMTANDNIRVATITAPGALVTLTSNGGSISDDLLASQITAATLSVTAAGGIGGSGAGAALDTSITTLDADAGSGGLFVVEQNALTLGTVTSVGNLNVSTTAGAIDAPSVTVTGVNSTLTLTAGTGNLTVGTLSTVGGNATLEATNGNIVDDGNDGTRITANVLSLEANAIGAAGANDIDTDVQTLIADANGGDVYVDDVGSLTLQNIDGGTIDIRSTNNLAVQDVDGTTIRLESINGSITDDGSAATAVTGQTVDLLANVSIGSAVAPVDTDIATRLDATATNGSMWINDLGDLTLGTLTALNGNISITANDSIIDDGNPTLVRTGALTLTAGGAIGTPGNALDTQVTSLSATSSNFGIVITETDDVIVGDITASGVANEVQLTSSTGAIRDDGNNATDISGGTLTLRASTGIGANADPNNDQLDTSVNFLDVETTSGSIYLREANAVTVNNMRAQGGGGDIVFANTTGNVTVTTALANDTVSITADGGTVTAGEITGGTSVLVDADTAIQDDNNATRITAPTVTLVAGTSIGAGANGAVDTDTATLTATAGNGGVNIAEFDGVTLTDVSAVGGANSVAVTAGGTITATSVVSEGDISLTATVGNIMAGTIDADGDITLTANAGTLDDDGNNSTRISGGTLTLASTSIGTSLAGEELDTDVDSITATASAGDIYIGELNAVTLTNVTATGPGRAISITNGSGNITATGVTAAGAGSTVTLTAGNGNVEAGAITAGGLATLTAAAGAITDDNNDGTVINAGAITLVAGTAVGTVTDFGAVTDAAVGSSVDIVTSGNLITTVDSNTGQINLRLAGGVPIIGGGAISLGNGPTARAGAVVLQAPGNLDISAMTPGAIAIGANNTTSVGLRSGGTLTLPSGGGLTDQPAGQLLVRGATDVIDNDGSPRSFSFAANSLDFRSGSAGGATTLNTTVGTLSADIGGGQDLFINETDGVALGSVTTTGNVNVVAGGDITDDGDPSGVTRVSGNVVTLNGTAIGTPASALDTQAAMLIATATVGGIEIAEADALALTANAGGNAAVRTTNGSLTVNGVTAGGGVDLAAGGANSVLTVDAAVLGNNGPVALAAAGTNGSIVLNNTVTSANNDVTLNAAGAIVANTGHFVSGNTLTATGSTIGTDLARLSTSVASLDATAGNGIFITETNDVTVNADAGAGAVDIQTTAGSITVAAASGSEVTLTAGSAGSGIVLNGQVDAGAGDVALTAAGAITGGGGNLVSGGNLTAQASAIGASGARVNTAIDSIDAVSAGGVFIANTGALTVGTVTGTDVGLSTTGNVIAGAGSLITATTLDVDGAAIGTDVARLNTSVDTLDATATNGLFVTDANALTVANAQGGAGVASIETTNGALTVTAASGNTVELTAGGDGSALTVNGAVTGSNGVTLTAGTPGTRGAITGGAGNLISGSTLTATGSNIGAQAARLNTAVATLDATSTNGVFVTDADALTVANVVAGAGAVDIQTTNGALTAGAVTGNGVTLIAGGAGSALTVNGAVDGGAGDVTLSAGTAGNRGAINVGASLVSGNALTVSGSSIGSSGARLNTNVVSLDATASNGVFVNEANALTVTSAQAGTGAVDIQTTNGALTVTAATGTGVALRAQGAGNGITINGAVNGGSGDVTLTADAAGAISAGAGNLVSGNGLTATAASIGSSAAQLNTDVTTLTAAAGNGGVFVNEQNGLTLTSVTAAGAGGNVSVTSGSGDILVDTVTASGTVALTASGGAITDDGDDTTRITGTAMTFSARSIGAGSTLTGSVLDSTMRLDLDATSLTATSTAGGIYIDELNGLTNVTLNAAGGAGGDIEVLTATGDLNLMSVTASDALLLAAGHNIFAAPGATGITARVAELRAGAADDTAGRIGTLTDPIALTLAAGDSLRLFVPQSVDPGDVNRAPSTLPSPGVNSSLTRFASPNALAAQAGFNQFLGLDTTPFSSPLESLVRTLQNQTQNVRTVLEIDWASFDSSVSLFGTLDPALCLPGDQRDEEEPAAGCQ